MTELMAMQEILWQVYRKGLLRDVQAHLVLKFRGESMELAKSGKGVKDW